MGQRQMTNGHFAAMYGAMAKKRLEQELRFLRHTQEYADFAKAAEAITSYDDLQQWAGSLPTPEETAQKTAEEIRREYHLVSAQIEELKRQRDDEIRNAEPVPSRFKSALIDRLAATVPVKMDEEPKKCGIIGQKLEELVEQYLLVHPVANPGFTEGDIVRVNSMVGYDFEDGTAQYHYGGDISDLPLGTRVIVLASDPNLVTVRPYNGERLVNEKGQSWLLHPSEVEQEGANFYNRLVQEAGSVNAAAKLLVAEATRELYPDLLGEAKEQIRARFDELILQKLSSLRRKYDLKDENLRAIAEGKGPVIDVVAYDHEQVTLPFSDAAKLAEMFLKQKTGREVKIRGDIGDEGQFTSAVAAAAGQVSKDPSLAGNIIRWMGALLAQEHYLVARELNVNEPTSDVVGAIFSRLMAKDGEPWTRRLMLYNDRDMYRGGDPFSPPSEQLVRVLKLEAGNGCNYGKCTFCHEYAHADFFVRKPSEFDAHVARVMERLGKDSKLIERVFIAGGNSFALPTKQLMQYLDTVERRVARKSRRGALRRVGIFTRTEGISRKSVDELQELVDHNLRLLYWGVETGAQEILDYVNKGITRKEMDLAGEKITQTDMMLSLMIMPGLGGIRFYEQHVRETRAILNALHPRYITFHTMTEKPGTRYPIIMGQEMRDGTNRPLTDAEVVEQIYDIVAGLNPKNFDRCLIATYYPPAAKIAINPIQFRGYLHRGDKGDILATLRSWYGDDRLPSAELPLCDFNQKSPLRKVLRR